MTPPRQSVLLDWLIKLAATEAPPQDVVAFNIGLFETERGYAACLVGCTKYDPDDNDWACDEAFFPSERYCDISLARPNEKWEAVRDRIAAEVRSYLASPAGNSSFLGRARAVTVGFEDGDLFLVSQ